MMINKCLFFKKRFLSGILLVTSMLFLSCSDDDDNYGGTNLGAGKGEFLIAVKGTSAEYIMQTDRLSGDDLHISSHVLQLSMTDYLWTFNENVAVGLVYMQGSPGIGYGFNLNADTTLNEISKFQISTRFTSYGFFDNYLVTSVGGEVPVDANGNALKDEQGNVRTDGATFVLRNANNFGIEKEKTILTRDFTSNGDILTFSGVVDLGNGQFLTGIIQSEYLEASEDNGGSSTGKVNYPDSVRVAVVDKDLNIVRIFGDNRISYSSGRYRSQYYSQMGKTGDGTVYVFSGSFDTDDSPTSLPCGALKVSTGADKFDESYYFNIGVLTEGYKFKRLWYISGHKFLLEMYNDTKPGLASEAYQYGIVDMQEKTYDKVTGLPSKGRIMYAGIPTVYKGKVYLPLTEYGQNAALYMVDPDSGSYQADKTLSITGATQIRGLGYLAID